MFKTVKDYLQPIAAQQALLIPLFMQAGEKQRAAICRALLPQPKLILADEATGNLDPENKTRILDLLFAAVKAHGTTLLAVTHDHELLGRFDRIIDFKSFRKAD
jgi:putative ABC transport system ATP-binding protein